MMSSHHSFMVDVENLEKCWKISQGLYKNQNDAKLLNLRVKHVNRSPA